MIRSRKKNSTTERALEFKGRHLSVTKVTVLLDEPAAIESQVIEFARQMSAIVVGMPVVLDARCAVDPAPLLTLLQHAGMQVLGVTEGLLAPRAAQLGLPVLPADGFADAPRPAPATTAAVEVAAAPPVLAQAATRIVCEPVRSGQQIYAAGGDLIVLAAVSAGAEVIADGCVHVYGRLSGRAVGGARGDRQARVFVRRNDAELIAVAGVYLTSEQMNSSQRGAAVMAFLRDDRLVVDALGA